MKYNIVTLKYKSIVYIILKEKNTYLSYILTQYSFYYWQANKLKRILRRNTINTTRLTGATH